MSEMIVQTGGTPESCNVQADVMLDIKIAKIIAGNNDVFIKGSYGDLLTKRKEYKDIVIKQRRLI